MEEKINQQINSVLWAAAFVLNFFWIINIFKEAFSEVKSFLNFYPPVGPLLGLYIFSGIVFLISYAAVVMIKPKSQKSAFWIYVISAVAFFFMVFPPIFIPIAHLLAEK